MQINCGTDSTEQLSHAYDPELNDAIVSTLTNIDELNSIDNNTGTCDKHTNKDIPISLDDINIINYDSKMKLRKAFYGYCMTLTHTGLVQKEDIFETIMYKLVNIGICDTKIL